MQPTRDEPVMAAPPATTVGGNNCIVNGDEDDTLDRTWESTGFRKGDLSDEDDSHVTAAYSDGDFAGS